MSWTDLSVDNIIPEGCRARQLKKRDSDNGYEFTNLGTDIGNSLYAQTVYIQYMDTIAKVDEAVYCTINYIVLTQMGIKKCITTFGEEGVRSILKEMENIMIERW